MDLYVRWNKFQAFNVLVIRNHQSLTHVVPMNSKRIDETKKKKKCQKLFYVIPRLNITYYMRNLVSGHVKPFRVI